MAACMHAPPPDQPPNGQHCTALHCSTLPSKTHPASQSRRSAAACSSAGGGKNVGGSALANKILQARAGSHSPPAPPPTKTLTLSHTPTAAPPHRLSRPHSSPWSSRLFVLAPAAAAAAAQCSSSDTECQLSWRAAASSRQVGQQQACAPAWGGPAGHGGDGGAPVNTRGCCSPSSAILECCSLQSWRE